MTRARRIPGNIATHSFSIPIQPTRPTAMRGPMAHPRLPPNEKTDIRTPLPFPSEIRAAMEAPGGRSL